MKQVTGYQAVAAQDDVAEVVVTTPDGRAFAPLPGRSLVAVFAQDADELFFLTHDILHEEQLDICLLHNGVLVDRLSLGQMFQPAELSGLQQTAPRGFTFNFPAEQSWQLQVATKPQFAFPDPRSAVSRLRMWQSYFTLTRSKQS